MPSAPPVIIGPGNLLSPAAPPAVVGFPDVLIVTGEAMIRVYAGGGSFINKPIAGAFLRTAVEVEGRQTYATNGIYPSPLVGFWGRFTYDPTEGWRMRFSNNGDGGSGWRDADHADVDSPADVINWEPISSDAQGDFVLTAGAPNPGAIVPIGGAATPGMPPTIV